ncbi:trichothecene 3-O-acetyltransferase [Pluteus cervinus]|uniref:Trichothecene 3-O-acetyltransferase n=1 Tax=Pluteus cervinus TaxID=181527 RepID=A0ACD3BAR1_9AGAR|nr:trichothecene 3-O-acetyltransferase [Pluteus cervinus]
MDTPAPGTNPNCYELDVFGQQPALNSLYTQITFCFSVSNASSHPAIIKTLTGGLERLSASFPWVAGQVVNGVSGDGNGDVFKIISSERMPRLIVKDLRDDPLVPSMEALKQANFPMSSLDESVVAPRKTLPGNPDEYASEPTPVFLLQANFIAGGLLLTFVALHSKRLLSKACRNEPFTSDEVSVGNLPRRNIIPLLDDSDSGLAHQVVRPTVSNNPIQVGAPPPRCRWAYFTFPSTSLAILKSLATETMTLSSGYVSTDDALSALIWQSVSRARLPRLTSATKATFARAIDPRRYLGIPQTYPGLVQNMTYNAYTIQELLAQPLGCVASELRAAVDPKTSNLGYKTRALATLLSRTADKGTISVTATLDLSVDIMLSSWGKVDSGLDFNLGFGKPDVVRRPQFVPVESLMYLMPKTSDGEIALAICLRDEDMERLRTDEEFTRYGIYVG